MPIERPATRLFIATVVLWLLAGSAMAATATKPRGAARSIVQDTGLTGGIIVHLHCNGGRLTAALHRNDRYLVRGLDPDIEDVAAARQYIKKQGVYGPVSVSNWDGEQLPYTNGIVNLVVSRQPLDIPMSEVTRVLCPNGVAYIKADDGWQKTVKPRPDEIDEWTHYLHGSNNNAVAEDTRIGPPKHIRWKAGPPYCRSHEFASSISTMVSANGRLIYVHDEGLIGQPRGVPTQWKLIARDAFNGTLLWKRSIPHWRGWGVTTRRRLVAVGDRVYVTLGNHEPVSILDADTGETIRTFQKTADADEIVCSNGVLIARACDEKKKRRSEDAEEKLIAVDAETGKALWSKQYKKIAPLSLAADGNRACYRVGQNVFCADLQTGKQLWRSSCNGRPGKHLIIYGDVVIVNGRRGTTAFALADGEKLWANPDARNRAHYPPECFIADGLIWNAWTPGNPRTFVWTPQKTVRHGYNPKTGKVERTITAKRLVTPGHHIRCYPPKATSGYLLLDKRGVEFFDVTGENHNRHNWLRAPCRHGVLPANGLLYVPPHQCFCYQGVLMNGLNAVSADVDDGKQPADGHDRRLTRGPASGTELHGTEAADNGDWPMYRHDPKRSGATKAPGPADPHQLWKVEFGGDITPPVIADGQLYVAESDAHTVHCLTGGAGEREWSYTAGARIDSAPTVYGNLVLFGTRGGYVHCLRASDGKLVWRFRAAPRQRIITAMGQLESAWPVHGSVLVQDGIAYFTAGRSSYLDGGMWVYGVKPETGRVIHKTRLKNDPPNVEKDPGRPFDMPGSRSDILVSDGEDLYLFKTRLNPDLTRQKALRVTRLDDRKMGRHLMCNDGFLNKTWFNRTYWTYGSRWPGYYFLYNAPKSGQLLVFDDDNTYGVHVYRKRHGHSPEFRPEKDGYEIFADRNDNEPVLRPFDVGREKGRGFSRSEPPIWSILAPVRVMAMVLTPDRLYAAGPPDIVPKDDPMAAFEGRKGSVMWVMSPKTGEKLAECKLNMAPVFDSLIANSGRLYMSTRNGAVVCFGDGN